MVVLAYVSAAKVVFAGSSLVLAAKARAGCTTKVLGIFLSQQDKVWFSITLIEKMMSFDFVKDVTFPYIEKRRFHKIGISDHTHRKPD